MVLLGDCLERLKELEANSVDAVVTDPPYGWRFMGKAWDGADIEKTLVTKNAGVKEGKAQAAGFYDQSLEGNEAFCAWTELYARELLRVLKPGAHALIFCGPRTYHAMAFGVERAGFEIRDQLQWVFGSGFPKSHDIEKALERFKSPDAYRYKSWGTALKPANEPIVLARKPLEKGLTVAQNVLKYGTGGLNIDASRIEGQSASRIGGDLSNRATALEGGERVRTDYEANPQGRWPANLLLDETAAEMLDEQSGPSSARGGNSKKQSAIGFSDESGRNDNAKVVLNDSGGASRFFYVAKASKRERNAGLGEEKCTHPTVKPLKLMEYLCKLITPKGGTILDPFCGSGSTGVAAFRLGFKFIGIEMSEEYAEIARKRLEHALKDPA